MTREGKHMSHQKRGKESSNPNDCNHVHHTFKMKRASAFLSGSGAMKELTSNRPKVLIVGSGITGAICSHQIRSLLPHVQLNVADMARGPGGRMSTTRHNVRETEIKANTGAQYASCCSEDIRKMLMDVCGQDPPLHIKEIETPMERSLHFRLSEPEAYTHFEIPGGTNNLVKQFLYAGRPDVVSFQTRLAKLWRNPENNKIVPQFDLRRKNSPKKSVDSSLTLEYDAVVLALPPKDIIKFFQNQNGNHRPRHDPQSQADLHRHFNQSNLNTAPLPDCLPLVFDEKLNTQLRKVQYIGQYSLALWFDNQQGLEFVQRTFEAFNTERNAHPVLDAVFMQQQGHVLVAQSTETLWKQYGLWVSAGGGRGGGRQKRGRSAGNTLNQIKGGGREEVRAILTKALEELAGGTPIPQVSHAKLLNWRTCQVNVPLVVPQGDSVATTTENGRVILTGDWCIESSFEGCYRAGEAAAKLVQKQLMTENTRRVA